MNGRHEKGQKHSLLTPGGVRRLQLLRSELLALSMVNGSAADHLASKYRSNYSQEMVNRAYLIVDSILKHARVTSWASKKSSHAKSMRENFKYLTAGQKTYTPSVFNGESYALAQVLIRFLVDFDLAKDIRKTVGGLLKGFFRGTLDEFLAVVLDNLRFQCRVFELARESIVHQEAFENLSHEIKESLEKYLIVASTVTEDTLPEYMVKYEQTICYFVEKVNALPYLKMIGADSKAHALEPFIINGQSFPMMQPCGKALVQTLLDYEAAISRVLIAGGHSYINRVYELYSTAYIPAEWKKLYEDFKRIVDEFSVTFEDYQTGGHLRGFNSTPNESKVKILEGLGARLKKLLTMPNGDPLPVSIHQGFVHSIHAYQTNMVKSKELGKAGGKTSQITMRLAIECLSIALKTTITNDDDMVRALTIYMQQVNKAAMDAKWLEGGWKLPFEVDVVDNVQLPMVELALAERLHPFANGHNGLLANRVRFMSAPAPDEVPDSLVDSPDHEVKQDGEEPVVPGGTPDML